MRLADVPAEFAGGPNPLHLLLLEKLTELRVAIEPLEVHPVGIDHRLEDFVLIVQFALGRAHRRALVNKLDDHANGWHPPSSGNKPHTTMQANRHFIALLPVRDPKPL